MCQKLLHIAYQHHSNKTSNAIEQIADYLSRLAAMKHAERWLVLSNADLVRSAELGIHANVVYLLENGVVDALGVDDVTEMRIIIATVAARAARLLKQHARAQVHTRHALRRQHRVLERC
jgi:hypothetical protein